MSKFLRCLVTASLLLVPPQLFAQSDYVFNKSRPYTQQDQDECVSKTQPKSLYICSSYPVEREVQPPTPSTKLAPDPSTPRFNQCIDTYRAVYNYVLSNCMQALDKDLSGRTNWLALWTEDAKVAKEIAWQRIDEVKLESIRQRHADNAALRDSRAGQTPLQNAIDRLNDAVNAPCIYFDEHHISRSCD
jgi:hypothetical protein